MVGRERELEKLTAFFSAAGEGEGARSCSQERRASGKTRLAEAAIAAGNLACLRGVADERGSSPYAPIAAVLRDYLRHEPDGLSDAEPLVAHLGALLPELGPATERHRPRDLGRGRAIRIRDDRSAAGDGCLPG